MIKVIEESRLTIAFIAQGCALAMAEMIDNKPSKYDELTDGLGQIGVMDMVTQHYWRIDELWKRVDKDEMSCVWDYDVSEEFGRTFTNALSEPDCPNSLNDGTGVDEFIMNIVKGLEAEGLLKLLPDDEGESK